MSHSNLQLYYRLQLGMVRNHGFTYSDIENMMVFERDVLIALAMEKPQG